MAGTQAPGVAVRVTEQTGTTEQLAGAVKVVVFVQAGVELNVAVTVLLAPSEVKPVMVYACGLVKGALKTCCWPPTLTVNIPVAGALANVILPVT